MNQAHLEFLASPDWARMLEADLLPWLEQVAELGDDVLEIGPGPGLTTDLLRTRAERITAVEVDHQLARTLEERLAGTNVEIVHGDASDTGLPADRFSAATCFSVLHHVPTTDKQDQILDEIHRVLRPGAALFVTDSRDLEPIREFHHDDVFVPLGEDHVVTRLDTAGFIDIDLEVGDYEIRFSATKPSPDRARPAGEPDRNRPAVPAPSWPNLFERRDAVGYERGIRGTPHGAWELLREGVFGQLPGAHTTDARQPPDATASTLGRRNREVRPRPGGSAPGEGTSRRLCRGAFGR